MAKRRVNDSLSGDSWEKPVEYPNYVIGGRQLYGTAGRWTPAGLSRWQIEAGDNPETLGDSIRPGYAQIQVPDTMDHNHPYLREALGQATYDPEYGYLLPSQVNNALTAKYFPHKSDIFDMAPGIMASAVLGAGLGGFLPFDGGAGQSIFSWLSGLGGGGGATLPESYWSMMADAGAAGGTATDVAAGIGGSTGGTGAGGLAELAANSSGIPSSLGGGTFAEGSLFPSSMTTSVAGGGGTVGALPTFTAGFGSSVGGTTPTIPPGGSSLSRIIDGNATTDDYLRTGGTALSTLLGLGGANNQQKTLEDFYNKAQNSPSMARFNASFAPGFDLAASDPGFQNALDTAANTSARALSVKYGNPAESPSAQAEMQKYLAGSLYLPQLNTYRSQNISGAGLGANLAGTFAGPTAQANAGTYNAIGGGLEALTRQQDPYAEFLKNFGNQFKLNFGGMSPP